MPVQRVEKRIEKAKGEMKAGVQTVLKLVQSIAENLPKQMEAISDLIADREFEVAIKFDNLTLNGQIVKTVSFRRSKKGAK